MENKIHAIKVTRIIQDSHFNKNDYNTIVFSKGTIIEIGNYKELKKSYSFDTFVEYENAVIIPGFVNTHTHSIQTFFRGLAENLQLLEWLNTVILPGEASLCEEEVYASSMLGFIDMVSNGTTFANDMITTHHSEVAIQAAMDMGIRVKTGKLLMDTAGPSNLIDDTPVAIEESYQLIEKFHLKTPLIEYSINPRFLVSCSPTLMKGCSRILEEYPDVSFHTHANENKSEIDVVKANHGDYIESLYNFGVLGNRSILAHGIWLDEKDINILATTNTAISHCPSSNAKLASGMSDWPKLQENSISVGLGTDGPPSNNTMDMFREMRMATFVQRLKTLDETKAPANKVFDLATIEGAKAIRRADLGTLEKGKKADFVIVDVSHPSNYPIHNFLNHIVFKASGNDVLKTFINGQVVYDKKQSSFEKMYPQTPANSISKVLNTATKYVENNSG